MNLLKSDIDQNEIRSYQEIYDKLMQKKVTLDFKKTKKIILGQFSITDSQANSILKKVFSYQNSDVLNREGFFTILRYIQCLQNKVDIETCNINNIKLPFPLIYNSKQNLKKSFQPSPEDLLDKSMIALKSLQNLIKDQIQSTQILQQINQSDEIKIEKQGEETNQKEKKTIEKHNEIKQMKKLIKFWKKMMQTKIIQQIIQFNTKNSQSLNCEEQYQIDNFDTIESEQYKVNEQMSYFPFFDSLENFLGSKNGYVSPNKIFFQHIEKSVPDFIEIGDDFEDQFTYNDKTKDIYVWISGYQSSKDGPLSSTYYTYNVCSEILTDSIKGTYNQYYVQRRYTDFIMLQQYFTKSKLGDIIPSLPEKEGVFTSLKNMVVENSQFISQRQEQLQLFLNYLTKYKEDQIFLSFLSNNKKFNLILKEFRFQKEENQDEETFLPDPDEFTRKQKLKELIAGKSLMDILDYFKGEKEIEAKFQEEYQQVQQHYKTLQNKQLELSKFKQCVLQFYEPIDKFSAINSLQPRSIISEENINYLQETQKLFQANYPKHQKLVMNKVTQIEFQLNSLSYSYEQIQKQIYKWFAEKKRLREEKISNKLEIQKNDFEEGRLQYIISKTNETLIKLNSQIAEELTSLLQEFVEGLTQN